MNLSDLIKTGESNTVELKEKIDERTIEPAVAHVNEKGHITNKEYQEICRTPNRTASEDLADLVSSGLFEQGGITGKRTVYIIRYCKDARWDNFDNMLW